MQLGVKRDGKVVTMRIETGTDETADGKVVGLSLTQFAGDGKLTQTGRVENGQLVLRTSASDEVVKKPWDDAVIGLFRQDRIFEEKKAKPGDAFFLPQLRTDAPDRDDHARNGEGGRRSGRAGSQGCRRAGGVSPRRNSESGAHQEETAARRSGPRQGESERSTGCRCRR